MNDTSGAVVKDAVAIISVVHVSGTPPPTPPTDFGQGSQPTNTFKFDTTNNQDVFNLDRSVLAPRRLEARRVDQRRERAFG